MTNMGLIEQAYAAYNRQDADALLALVSEDVDWPDGQARLHGKQELRTYWARQWAETRTHDEVLGVATPMPNRAVVRIRQTVHALTGAVISTGTFEHECLIEDRLITRLDICRLSMNIGIVGAGHVGGALAHVFSGLGHCVRIANSRSPDTLSELSSQSGAIAVWAADAVSSAELLVIAIPEKNVPALSSDIFRGAAADLVVIDTGNYYPRRDGAIPEIEEGLPESAWVSKHIKRPVIKAFNNVDPKLLGASGKTKEGKRLALPIAGDDAKAKALVMQLVDDMGFDPVDGGPLAGSWRQQPGTPAYGTNLDADGVRRGLADASRERKGEWIAKR